MKIAIETKSTKEIEFTTGYFKYRYSKWADNYFYFFIDQKSIVVVFEDMIVKYNHKAGEHYIQNAMEGTKITCTEFSIAFNKVFNSIENVCIPKK